MTTRRTTPTPRPSLLGVLTFWALFFLAVQVFGFVPALIVLACILGLQLVIVIVFGLLAATAVRRLA